MCVGAFYLKNKYLQVSWFWLGVWGFFFGFGFVVLAVLFWFWGGFLGCFCFGLVFFDKWKECKDTSE